MYTYIYIYIYGHVRRRRGGTSQGCLHINKESASQESLSLNYWEIPHGPRNSTSLI